MAGLLRTIVIVGGGFSGTVVAANLLRRPPPGPTRLILIERANEVARGAAEQPTEVEVGHRVEDLAHDVLAVGRLLALPLQVLQQVDRVEHLHARGAGQAAAAEAPADLVEDLARVGQLDLRQPGGLVEVGEVDLDPGDGVGVVTLDD